MWGSGYRLSIARRFWDNFQKMKESVRVQQAAYVGVEERMRFARYSHGKKDKYQPPYLILNLHLSNHILRELYASSYTPTSQHYTPITLLHVKKLQMKPPIMKPTHVFLLSTLPSSTPSSHTKLKHYPRFQLATITWICIAIVPTPTQTFTLSMSYNKHPRNSAAFQGRRSNARRKEEFRVASTTPSHPNQFSRSFRI